MTFEEYVEKRLKDNEGQGAIMTDIQYWALKEELETWRSLKHDTELCIHCGADLKAWREVFGQEHDCSHLRKEVPSE